MSKETPPGVDEGKGMARQDVAVERRGGKHGTGRERACAQRQDISEGKEPDGTGRNEETQRSRTTTYEIREWKREKRETLRENWIKIGRDALTSCPSL